MLMVDRPIARPRAQAALRRELDGEHPVVVRRADRHSPIHGAEHRCLRRSVFVNTRAAGRSLA
jgi:hypothetical protein